MEIEIVATESANRANTSLENLDVTVRKFRERIKNDLSSMKASSDRVQSEVSQMSEKYKAAQEILTSPVMEKAIANAGATRHCAETDQRAFRNQTVRCCLWTRAGQWP
ncbi:MAG: hypothetical protein IPK44_25060 [Candidatus Accumulibacter sp.]|uniref:hypothetical protein n=1 Tax=Accumulibacter sp. TaxID=2053492 RepID=UPI00258C0051|nr:hypothetical protein [Accumulibacter sp.]MBK8117560.1 hypothetical protein [Accumulibacter sp.]